MLKAVLFDFNGVIINDEPLHQKLLDKILVEENLRPKPEEYWELCVGRSDRACLRDLLERRGRVPTDDYLDGLIERKSRYYLAELSAIEKLPSYAGIEDILFQIRAAHLVTAVVSGALRAEIDLVLQRLNLTQAFSTVIAGDDISASKPDPEGYLKAVAALNTQHPDLQLEPQHCLVIEDTPAGIEAAKNAGMQVVGVANTYPFHMIQRQANWTVDYLTDLELERVQQVFLGHEYPQAV